MADSKAQRSFWGKKAARNGNGVSNTADVWLPPSQKFNIPNSRVRLQLPFPRMPLPTPERLENPT